MIDTTTTTKVREHSAATGRSGLITTAPTTIATEGQTLSVAQLAPLDQFHLRGVLATQELARRARLEPFSRVLDSAAASAVRLAISPPHSAVRSPEST